MKFYPDATGRDMKRRLRGCRAIQGFSTGSHVMIVPDALQSLSTPSLLLDEGRMLGNIARLRAHLDTLGVALRPHLKTAKSVDVARRVLTGGNGPATVSTLKEAEVFAAAGVRDILYAVGIAPQKLPRVLALRATGCDLTIVLDSAEQAKAVVRPDRAEGHRALDGDRRTCGRSRLRGAPRQHPRSTGVFDLDLGGHRLRGQAPGRERRGAASSRDRHLR